MILFENAVSYLMYSKYVLSKYEKANKEKGHTEVPR